MPVGERNRFEMMCFWAPTRGVGSQHLHGCRWRRSGARSSSL